MIRNLVVAAPLSVALFADNALAQVVPLPPAYNATMPAIPAGAEYGANNSTGSTLLEDYQEHKNATVAMEIGADGEVRPLEVDTDFEAEETEADMAEVEAEAELADIEAEEQVELAEIDYEAEVEAAEIEAKAELAEIEAEAHAELADIDIKAGSEAEPDAASELKAATCSARGAAKSGSCPFNVSNKKRTDLNFN